MPTKESDWLQRGKDKLPEHAVGVVLALLPPLFGTLLGQLSPLLLAPLWPALDTRQQQKIVGTSILLALSFLASAVVLHRQYRRRLYIRFGVKWDRKSRQPYCPGCEIPLSSYGEPKNGCDHLVFCSKCKTDFPLTDDHGSHLTLFDAQRELNAPAAWERHRKAKR